MSQRGAFGAPAPTPRRLLDHDDIGLLLTNHGRESAEIVAQRMHVVRHNP